MPLKVLYSKRDAKWKLADFGFTTEGTTTTVHTSNLGRGTEGYRAPELLLYWQGKNSVYNNKVDIWSIGCILFEFAVGQRPFPSDFATYHYQSTGDFPNITLDDTFSELCKEKFTKNITSILQITASARPSASDLVQEFVENWKATQVSPHTATSPDRFLNKLHLDVGNILFAMKIFTCGRCKRGAR
jgi:serine/threonine protein kinase